MHGVCNTVSCCTAKLHFLDSYSHSSQQIHSDVMSCKSAILKKSRSKWLDCGKALQHIMHRARFLRFRVSPGRAETVVKWGGKTNHRSIAYWSQRRLCQKLPKSVAVRRSYSVQHHCRFIETLCIWNLWAEESLLTWTRWDTIYKAEWRLTSR